MPANFNAYNPNLNPGFMNYGVPQYVAQPYQPQSQQYQQPQGMQLQYVHGIEGANAYPMMDNGNWYYDNMGSGRNYYDGYDDGNASGRRYYDSEKEKSYPSSTQKTRFRISSRCDLRHPDRDSRTGNEVSVCVGEFAGYSGKLSHR